MDKNTFQEKLVESIMPLFESVIVENKKKYYFENPKPQKEDIDEIIRTRSTANSLISGIAGFIPGPLGLIAIVPEIKMTMGNSIIQKRISNEW